MLFCVFIIKPEFNNSTKDKTRKHQKLEIISSCFHFTIKIINFPKLFETKCILFMAHIEYL